MSRHVQASYSLIIKFPQSVGLLENPHTQYTTRDAQVYLSILHLLYHIKALKSKTASSHLVHCIDQAKKKNKMPCLGYHSSRLMETFGFNPKSSQRRSCFRYVGYVTTKMAWTIGPVNTPNSKWRTVDNARLRQHKYIQYSHFLFVFHRGKALWISVSSSCLCSPKSCTTLLNSGRQGKTSASTSTRQGHKVTMATIKWRSWSSIWSLLVKTCFFSKATSPNIRSSKLRNPSADKPKALDSSSINYILVFFCCGVVMLGQTTTAKHIPETSELKAY